MAEENPEKPAEEAKKDAPKEGAEAASPAEGAPKKKKSLPVFAIGLGGGGAAIVAMAYFLTVAAVETGASILPQPLPGKETKVEETEKSPETAPPAEGAEGAAEGPDAAKPEGEPKKDGPAPPSSGYIELDEIMTNPRGSNQKRFVACRFAIAFDAKDSVAVSQSLTQGEGKGQVNSELIALLRGKTVDDLEGSGASFEMLKREVREIVNRVAFPKGEGRVTQVYSLKFILQ